MLGLGDGAQAAQLRRFGWELGVAFQMADDLIDLTSSEEEAGKSVARDLAKGKLTLPVIHALAVTTGPEAAPLRLALDVLAGQGAGDAEAARRQVQRAVAAADGVGYTKRRAMEIAHGAVALLESAVPDSLARRLLVEKTLASLERKR
jgi:octaprenyl-diphosphate synthase